MKRVILFCCIAISLLSCENKKEDPKAILGLEYFPMNVGRQYIYQIDSIIFDDFNQSVDTFSSQLRIIYANEFKDSTYTPSIRVEYDNPDKGFNEPNNRWTSVIKMTNNAVINYSDTFRTIKMVFPVKEGSKWNCNLYNNLNEQLYKYKNVGKPYAAANFTFSKTATVVQNELKTLLTEINAFEVYAKDVGLIYAENTYIQRFDGKVSGRKIITTLKDYN